MPNTNERDALYRKKPVVISAMQWDGTEQGCQALKARFPALDTLAKNGHITRPEVTYWRIGTLEGGHAVSPGDWIIQGVKGEFYPCKPDIFAATYELAATAPNAAPEKCRTCNGHGMIGGLLPGDGGYDGQDCPDCAAPNAGAPLAEDEQQGFNTGTPELDALLQETWWMAKGPNNHDTAMSWMNALEAVLPMLAAAPAQQAGASTGSATSGLPWHLPVEVWSESERVALKDAERAGGAQQAGAPLPLAPSEAVTKDSLVIGGRYNWKNQPERLVYMGLCEPRNGRWHQFAKVEAPTVVWCEVLGVDLHRLEATPQQATLPASEAVDWSFAGWFLDTSADGDPPHWEQVAQEHANDPDVVSLGFRAQPQADAAEPVAKGGAL